MVKILLSVFIPLGLWSVDFNGNSTEKLNINNQDLKLPEVKASAKAKETAVKEWTIMVYTNAKNDLERFGISDMNEMEKVGSDDKINIVVEFGRIKGYDSTNGDWTGVRRYYVTKDNDPQTINSKLIEDLGEVDMGSYKSLIDFGKWAKKNFPAKKYFLIVWNHGSGWEKGRLSITKGISYDDVSKNHITTPQLGMALAEIGKVDILGMDACLMGMAEVAYEVKDYVTYIIASEETEPGDGYTYDGFLSKLQANPTMEPLALAKTVAQVYIQHYQTTGDGSTQAVIKANYMDGFLKAVNEFAYALNKVGDINLMKNAASKAQSFAISDNKDLYHFALLIYSSTNDNDLKTKAKALMDYIKNKLIAWHGYTNSEGGWWGPTDYSNSYGIAIYIPSYSIADGYEELKWAKYSNWDELLKWYLGAKTSDNTNTIPQTQQTTPWYEWLFGNK